MHLNFHTMFKKLLTLVCVGSLTLAVSAQWIWVDKDGRKNFSDRAPPSYVQEKDILKRPPGLFDTLTEANVNEAVAPIAAVKTSSAKNSGKDPQLEAKRKKAEEAEAEKKKLEEEKIAAAKTENCTRAKRGLASFKTGERIATTNAKGEREIMDDATRASETQRLQSAVDANCGPSAAGQ